MIWMILIGQKVFKDMQRNWIGSEGVLRVDFKVEGTDESFKSLQHVRIQYLERLTVY